MFKEVLKTRVQNDLKGAEFVCGHKSIDSVSNIRLVEPFVISNDGEITFSGCCDAKIFLVESEAYNIFPATFHSSARIDKNGEVVLLESQIKLVCR